MDMVNYLSSLGHEPSKTKNRDHWYLSPLREEKTPSFKVNQKLNRWCDHDLGKGGNLIDFGIEYHRCTGGELMNKLEAHFYFQQPIIRPQKKEDEPTNKIKVLSDLRLSDFRLPTSDFPTFRLPTSDFPTSDFRLPLLNAIFAQP